MRASAPGKVMLAGEYAVLEGGCALVMAVDRRARVLVADPGTTLTGSSPPPEAVATLDLARQQGLLARPYALQADASALCEGPRKLGLGSSAAVAVAALTAALASEGTASLTGPLRARIAQLARAGHRAVQGGGSGVDVIASAHGGVVRVGFPDGLAGEPSVSPVVLPAKLPWAVLWTGSPARTSDLLRAVRALAGRDPDTYRRRMGALRDAEAALFDALRTGDMRDALRAVQTHHRAQSALGHDAGVPVVTEAMATLAAAVEPLGAAVKPSGAGGGDIVLAAAQDGPTLDAVLSEGARLGFARLSLSIDHDGARTDQGDPSR